MKIRESVASHLEWLKKTSPKNAVLIVVVCVMYCFVAWVYAIGLPKTWYRAVILAAVGVFYAVVFYGGENPENHRKNCRYMRLFPIALLALVMWLFAPSWLP